MLTEKKYILILVLTFTIAALLSSYPGVKEVTATPSDLEETGSTPGDTPPEKVPHIAIDSATYDAGDVYEGTTVVHAFTVKNTGTAELSIKDVKAG